MVEVYVGSHTGQADDVSGENRAGCWHSALILFDLENHSAVRKTTNNARPLAASERVRSYCQEG